MQQRCSGPRMHISTLPMALCGLIASFTKNNKIQSISLSENVQHKFEEMHNRSNFIDIISTARVCVCVQKCNKSEEGWWRWYEMTVNKKEEMEENRRRGRKSWTDPLVHNTSRKVCKCAVLIQFKGEERKGRSRTNRTSAESCLLVFLLTDRLHPLLSVSWSLFSFPLILPLSLSVFLLPASFFLSQIHFFSHFSAEASSVTFTFLAKWPHIAARL